MALFLNRQQRQAKRITLKPRCPVGRSPLQQTEPAYPAASRNKQAGPASTTVHRRSQGSASLSSGMSSRASSSSMSSKDRRDSGTASLSRITLSPDLDYFVTHVEPADNLPMQVEHETCEELYTANGNFVSLRLSRFLRNERPQKNSKKYLNIPLEFLDYDRNDKDAAQCIRARDFHDCKVGVRFRLFPRTETAVVYGKPVLSLDGGKAWANVPKLMQVVDYIETQTSVLRPSILHGNFRLRIRNLGDLWLKGVHVDMGNFGFGQGYTEIEKYLRAGERSRRILRQWITDSRLVMKNVRMNSLGRPIAGTLDLLGKVYDPDFDSDEDWYA